MHAGIAQLVEHLNRNQRVEGSSPFAGFHKPLEINVSGGFCLSVFITMIMVGHHFKRIDFVHGAPGLFFYPFNMVAAGAFLIG